MPIMTNPEIEAMTELVMQHNKKLAELKKSLPPIPVKNYEFKNWDGGTTSLADMFGKHKQLVLIHNMGKQCKYCTMWANGFEGIYHHFEDKAAFVLVNHDSIAVQKEFAKERGWTFPIYSAEDNSFSKDLGFAGENNSPEPGVSTFSKNDDGSVELLAQANFGPGDNYCVTWHLYDLLPGSYTY